MLGLKSKANGQQGATPLIAKRSYIEVGKNFFSLLD